MKTHARISMAPSLPLLLLLLPTSSLKMSRAAAVDGVSHDLWWWLALGLCGYLAVQLMFLLLIFWYRTLPPPPPPPTSPSSSTPPDRQQPASTSVSCHHDGGLEKHESGGLSHGTASASPAMTATRHGSSDAEEAAVDPSQYWSRTFGLHGWGAVGAMPSPPLQCIARPASRSAPVPTVLVAGHPESRRSSDVGRRGAVAAAAAAPPLRVSPLHNPLATPPPAAAAVDGAVPTPLADASDHVTHYYFGGKRTLEAAAERAAAVHDPRDPRPPLPPRTSAPPHREHLERRPLAPAPAPGHESPAASPAAVAAPPTPSGSAVFNPLCMTAPSAHSDTGSLAEVDGVTCPPSPPHGMRRGAPSQQPTRRLELFRVSGESDVACAVAAASTTTSAAEAAASSRTSAATRLHATEERHSQRLLLPPRSPARRQRRRSATPPQTRTPAPTRSASAAVGGAVPQLFFPRKGAAPVRPPDTASTTTRLAHCAAPLSVAVLSSQAPASALVSPSSSSLSPQSRATSAAAVATARTGAAYTTASAGSSSTHRLSPQRQRSGRLRSASQVTFLNKGDITADSVAPPAQQQQQQQQQLSQCRESSTGSTGSSRGTGRATAAARSAWDTAGSGGGGSGGGGGAVRLERLADPYALGPGPATTTTTTTAAAAAPAQLGVPIVQGHRGSLPPSAATPATMSEPRGGRRQCSPPSGAASAGATPPFSAMTAAPLELLAETAATNGARVDGEPQLQREMTALVERAADNNNNDGSSSADDGDSVGSEASTVAAHILPSARRDRRGVAAPGTAAAAAGQHPAALVYGAAAAARPLPTRPSHIEVLRITQPTGVAVQLRHAASPVVPQRQPSLPALPPPPPASRAAHATAAAP